MALKPFRPLTPAQRFTLLNSPTGLSKKRPERALTEPKPKTGGRNVYGRVTSRRRGGGAAPATLRRAAVKGRGRARRRPQQ